MFESKLKRSFLIMILTMALSASFLYSQPRLEKPRTSQHAMVMQKIGLTDITIDYHRPGVKERKIWGGLVPYNEVWRAGANENTTISITDPVMIEGQKLDAGKYGLHMIPTENEWTIIFSNVNTGWGSFSYDEKNDVLRVNVKPESAPFQERMNFRFDNPTEHSAVAALYWEKLRVPFKIEVNVPGIVLKNMREELYGLDQFFWQSWSEAAEYCLQNDMNFDEAMTWVDKSISMNENFTNLRVKAGLLEKQGNTAEANKLMESAMKTATENELNQYGYQLLFSDKTDKAIEIFQKNVKRHPESWNVYDSLAEGYAKKGETKMAIQYYTKALEMVKDPNQKKRITGVLNNLKSN